MEATKTSESRNIRGGVILSYLILAVSIIGSLFVTNRVLNYIGDYNYGLYSFVNSIISWLNILSTSLIASFLRYTSIEAKNNNGDVGRTNTIYLKVLGIMGAGILFVGVFAVGILYFLKINFAHYSWEESQIIYVLALVAVINISITLPSSIFTQFVVYKKRFIFEKSLLLTLTIAQFAAHFLIAYFTKNVVFIAVYSVAATLLTLATNYFFSKKYLDMRFANAPIKDNKLLLKSIWAFSSVLILNSVVDQVNSHLDKTLLGFFSKPENVTIYQMGHQFDIYLSSLAVAISGVFAPKIHELCVNDEGDKVNALFLRISKLQAIVVVFVAFGFVSCGYDFVVWWLGKDRINTYYVGSMLMLLSIMPLSVKLALEIQKAKNKLKFRSVLFFFMAIFNALLSIVLLITIDKEYSVFACLAGTVVSSTICQWVAMNIYNSKVMQLPIKKHLLNLTKYIIFGLIGTAVAIGTKFLLSTYSLKPLFMFLIEGFAFVICYLILLLAFDRVFIFSFLKKKN